MTLTIDTDFEISLDRDAYLKLLTQLLLAPMGSANRSCIANSYAWSNACEETLGTLRQLRNRLAMCKTKAHLDNKNPAPASAGKRDARD